MIHGIDVSVWQGNIDWNAVRRAGVEFAFIRASEGAGVTDNKFHQNWNNAKSAGVARAAYHFARPDLGNSPQQEADYFASVVGTLAPGDVVALDLEAGGGDLTNWAREFLDHLCQAHGYPAGLLYGSTSFLSQHVPHGLGSNYGLWQAQWGTGMPNPAAGWPFIAVWQDSDAGSEAGITGRVDEDEFNGDMVQFLKYGLGGGGSAPAPSPQPAPAPAPAPAGSGHDYTVVGGDTLSGIASRFGVGLAQLEAANPQISNPNLIHPGDVVHLPGGSAPAPPPPPAGQSYIVRPGDTLWGISARFGKSLQAVEQANPQIGNPNLIYPGQLVHIP